MASRWKIHHPLFRGADTYEFKLKSGDVEHIIPLVVDELGYFHLDQPAPAGFYGIAKFIGTVEGQA